MHEENCFLTLTYSPEHLPADGSLNKSHFQLFLKRLRKKIAPRKISYFHCGEYGDDLGRPHYHALLFGLEFSDRRFYKKSKDGHNLYTSETLDQIWGFGSCWIGELNFETAAYCARYCLKKITGDAAESHYKGKQPEYCTMSTKPAIGARWAAKYQEQTYRQDKILINGVLRKPPRYYDKLLRRTNIKKYEKVKSLRNTEWTFTPVEGKKKLTREQQREQSFNQTKKRLQVREEVTNLRLKQFKRNLE